MSSEEGFELKELEATVTDDDVVAKEDVDDIEREDVLVVDDNNGSGFSTKRGTNSLATTVGTVAVAAATASCNIERA